MNTIPARTTSKVKMMTPHVPELTKVPNPKMKDPAPVSEDSTIIDVVMVLGAILFSCEEMSGTEGTEKRNGSQTLSGNELVLQHLWEEYSWWTVMKEEDALPEMNDAQMHQDIDVTTADY